MEIDLCITFADILAISWQIAKHVMQQRNVRTASPSILFQFLQFKPAAILRLLLADDAVLLFSVLLC
jgi:hypothetical protein